MKSTKTGDRSKRKKKGGKRSSREQSCDHAAGQGQLVAGRRHLMGSGVGQNGAHSEGKAAGQSCLAAVSSVLMRTGIGHFLYVEMVVLNISL